MKIQIIVSLIALSGILIAALMSSYGYLYRNREEQKKSARKVLYLLLEIRHSVIKSLIDPKEATENYIDYLVSRFCEQGVKVDRVDIEMNLKGMIEGHINNIITVSVTDIESRLLSEYEEALSLMAVDKPIMAYLLRGKERIQKLIHHTEEYQEKANDFLDESIDEEWIKNILITIGKEAKKDSYSDIVEILNNDVLRLSRECGKRDMKQSKKIIARSREDKNLLDFSDLDRIVDKFILKIIEETKKHQSNSGER